MIHKLWAWASQRNRTLSPRPPASWGFPPSGSGRARSAARCPPRVGIDEATATTPPKISSNCGTAASRGEMDSARVAYRSRPGTAPEDEVRALAAAYRLVLQAHAEKEKGARPGTLEDDVREEKNAHTAERSIPG